jgi:two-component system OmpR family response regulator
MAELTKILQAEDDLDNQKVALMALDDIGGYSVVQCSSGPETLSKASEFVPDLLLLDVMMPEMTGPETLIELRKLPGYETIPAIFFTAKVQPDEVEEYLNIGAIAVIAKPFDVMTLADEVRGLWDTAIMIAKVQSMPRH